MGVEERLLLDGIALHTANVSPRYVELPSAVEANLADAQLPFRNRAAVAAGVAAHAITIQFLVEISLAHVLAQKIAKSRQGTPRVLSLF
jgi:hypothetical protein